MTDILERLKNSSKINGAYPRDIEDAIATIKYLREWQRLAFEAEPNIDLAIDFQARKEDASAR